MKNFNQKRILLTGGAGFLGYHVAKELIRNGVKPKNIHIPRSKNCDLRVYKNAQRAVSDKDLVIHLAAKVGGIAFNKAHPATIFDHNTQMNMNLVQASRQAGVNKFVMIGSVCEYPKITPVPFREKDLWNGYPEESNGAYGLSKKMTLVQGQAYRQEFGFNYIHLLMTNLYGPRDNFDPATSHVIPALIKKVHAKKIKPDNEPLIVWGTGKPTREFIFVEDAARAIVLAAQKYDEFDPINIGSGMEISIKELVGIISKNLGYKGKIFWDKSKPDGQPRRCIDTSRAFKEFGFRAKVDFEQGLKQTIDWYLKNLT